MFTAANRADPKSPAARGAKTPRLGSLSPQLPAKTLREASAIDGMLVAQLERMKWGLLSVLFFLSGCYTMADEARARATYDLGCPSDEIETYHAVGGTTRTSPSKRPGARWDCR